MKRKELIVIITGARYSVVDVATRYELGGTGIESRCGRDFPHLSRPFLGLIQPPVKCVPALFHAGKAAGARR